VIDAALVADRVAAVRRRIDAAGGVAVTLVAVTKGFGPDALEAAARAGVTDIGENYAQELATKADTARDLGLTVHFIGRLQTNKVRGLAGTVGYWQSVDRPTVAIEIAKRAPGARVLVEVNVSGEAQKGGCDPTDADKIVGECARLGLDVQGLMAIGRAGEPEDARPGFRLLRRMVDNLGLAVCSMGMTADLEIGVEEGATMVRVGSALFGERPAHGWVGK
jgi:pyridoxal phosphate enzyme (YggS family)